MTNIVLQQLFCFMTHNINHIYRVDLVNPDRHFALVLGYFWFAIWLIMYFASLICFTPVFQSTSPYWCFSRPNTMWIFVTITLGHFPLILPTLWCYIQLTWQLFANSTTKYISYHIIDGSSPIYDMSILYNLNLIWLRFNVLWPEDCTNRGFYNTLCTFTCKI